MAVTFSRRIFSRKHIAVIAHFHRKVIVDNHPDIRWDIYLLPGDTNLCLCIDRRADVRKQIDRIKVKYHVQTNTSFFEKQKLVRKY